ncbi:MAG: proliferating cell nuclear antigen [Harvfovirus sp.]|uniref:Proliferating cell nuclear antigen n=1 Tax=Harvfovirus sp. TaxID=2487768 RepID=A0A3G5A3G9_9VIRU|nr:MAG: proliferating cell nuclear antigen [Harvfovirus sp.]
MSMKKGNGKLLEVKLVDVMTWKTLFDVMKDILGDIIIEFKQDPDMNNRNDSDETADVPVPVGKGKQKVVQVEAPVDKKKKNQKNQKKGKAVAVAPAPLPVKDESDESDEDDKHYASNEDAAEPEEVEIDGTEAEEAELEEEANEPVDPDEEEEGEADEDEEAEPAAQAKSTEGTDSSKTKKKEAAGGIKIVAINYTRTLLILVKLDAKEFSIFKVSKSIYDVGVNLLQLNKLIKTLDKDDILTISIDEEDTQMLVLDVENEVKNSRTCNRLKMLDINKKSYKIPATKFDVTITMDAVDFHKTCKEMNQIAEYVEILCKENSITFTCKGDCSEKSTTLDATESNGIKIKFANPKKKVIVQGIFELKHFVMFTKCASLCPNIQVYMKNNYPIFIKYTVAKLGHVLLGLIPITDANINSNFSDDDEDYSDDEKPAPLLK